MFYYVYLLACFKSNHAVTANTDSNRESDCNYIRVIGLQHIDFLSLTCWGFHNGAETVGATLSGASKFIQSFLFFVLSPANPVFLSPHCDGADGRWGSGLRSAARAEKCFFSHPFKSLTIDSLAPDSHRPAIGAARRNCTVNNIEELQEQSLSLSVSRAVVVRMQGQ